MDKNTIGFKDFEKLDLRIGEVKDATPVEGSRKLMMLTVDFGTYKEPVTILAGILGVYNKEDVIRKKFIFVANLEPKEMAGALSNGMMLAADVENEPFLLEVPQKLANGSQVC